MVSDNNELITLPRYVACYALFAVFLALVYLSLFVVWGQTLYNIILLYSSRPEARTLWQFLRVLVLGFSSFLIVMMGEPYLRNGMQRGLLLKRFLRLAIIFVVIAALGIGLNTMVLQGAA
jgi:hypothetical protein